MTISSLETNAETAIEAGIGDARGSKKSLRQIFEFLVILVCVLAFAMTVLFFLVSQLTGKTDGTRDYVVYWATGQQLAHHANPYDKEALLKVERSAGFPSNYPPMFMRNPPWALLLTLPLGFLSLRMGALLWSLLLILSAAFSVHMIWEMQGRPRNRLHLLGYSFAPALICAVVGQTSLFALPGYVLFLRLHRQRPMLAGASLWLCALKPHLFLPFGIVLLAWVIFTKNYRLVIGGLTALAISCGLVFFVDGLAWTQYRQMIAASSINTEFIPCLSVALRLWTFPHAMGLQYLPTALGCVWALLYFWPRRNRWDWTRDGNLLLLISVVTAPYSWLMDQAVLLPALLQGIYVSHSRTVILVAALVSAAVEIELLSGVLFPSPLYLWTAPAWLAWYLIACRSGDRVHLEEAKLI